MQPTIASNDKEFIIFRDLVRYNIGKSCNNLLFRCQVGTLLELEISDSSRQRQITIDTSKVDEAASSTDSGLLACNKSAMCWMERVAKRHTFVLWLVIKRKWFGPSFYAENSP